jgi:hypothetical protein
MVEKDNMKKITIATLVLFGIGFMDGIATASDFKLIDVKHPVIVTGAFTDLKGHTDGGAAVALVAYKPIKGWTVADIGGSLGRALGGPSMSAGGSYNLIPDVKATGLMLLTALYPDSNKFANLKSILSSPVGTPDITMSFGPHYSYVFNNGIKGKGMVTLFYGAEWNF